MLLSRGDLDSALLGTTSKLFIGHRKYYMDRFLRTCWFRKATSTIEVTGKVNSFSSKDLCSAVSLFKESGSKKLNIDFSRVTHAYPNGMLPLIASLESLRQQGIEINAKLPQKDNVRRLFSNVNWAHHISPNQFAKSEAYHDRHLISRFFSSGSEQNSCVNDFMDVVLRNMPVPKDIVSGLEWSINEVTDNVLNHSESAFGGIVQASTYLKNNSINFAVADSGQGILGSLKEGIPTLRTDLQAIGEAIKAGVTRNKDVGQGNGLAGTLSITTLTGGSFDITSGYGRMLCSNSETKRHERKSLQYYQGTFIAGQINITDDFSISEALDFHNGVDYEPLNIIDTHYEMDDKDCLLLKMKDESTGFGTRHSGVQIRTKIKNLLGAKENYPIIIDWEGVPIISSSFADEVVGKLFLEMGAIAFSSRIRNVGMELLITKLLDKAIAQRLTQEND